MFCELRGKGNFYLRGGKKVGSRVFVLGGLVRNRMPWLGRFTRVVRGMAFSITVKTRTLNWEIMKHIQGVSRQFDPRVG